MKARFILIMAALFLGTIGSTTVSFSQEGRGHHRAGMSPEKMMEMCQKMMERHETMRQKMAQKDERLQQRVDTMNAATGEAKVEAMADVINELVEQRRQMHEMMMRTEPMMMRHMMEHMHPEMMQKMREQCPLMIEMETSKEKEMEANDHAEHH